MNEAHRTCDRYELLIQDYLDGYLLGPERGELEAHLSRCAACRTELLRMKELEARLDEDPPVEVPPHLAAAILQRLPAGAYRSGWTRPSAYAGLALGAAMAFLLAVLPVLRHRPAGPEVRSVEIVFHAPAARSVHVAGDFNDWDTGSHAMKLGPDGTWRLSLRLPPGLYQYNFFVDNGFWAENPGNQALVNDGFGGRNALLLVEG